MANEVSKSLGNCDLAPFDTPDFPFPTTTPTGPSDKEVNFSRILVLLAAALYGTNFACVKLLDESVPVGASAALRFTIAAITLSPWLFRQPESKDSASSGALLSSSSGNGVVWAGITVGVWNAIGYICQAVGLQTSGAGESAFICSLAVVVVPLLDFVFDGHRLKKRDVAALGLSVTGVALLTVSPDLQFALPSGQAMLNVVATCVQPVAFGVGFWRMGAAMQKFPDEAKRLTAVQLLTVASMSIVYAGCGGGGVLAPKIGDIVGWLQDPNVFLSLLWTGCMTTAFTVFLETLAMKNLSAGETTLLFSTEPVWGSAVAAYFLGERFGVNGIVGAAMILFTCAWSCGGLEGLMKKRDGKGRETKREDEFAIGKDLALQTGGLAAVSTITAVSGGAGEQALEGNVATVVEAAERGAEAVASSGVMDMLPPTL